MEKLFTGNAVTVPLVGTRVPLTLPAKAAGGVGTVIIQALRSNTGYIYVGDETVTSGNGISLASAQSVALQGNFRRDGVDGLFISDIYIDASVAAEGVTVNYIGKR